MVAEYERVVIFRLGRLKKGGSLGPGAVLEADLDSLWPDGLALAWDEPAAASTASGKP